MAAVAETGVTLIAERRCFACGVVIEQLTRRVPLMSKPMLERAEESWMRELERQPTFPCPECGR